MTQARVPGTSTVSKKMTQARVPGTSTVSKKSIFRKKTIVMISRSATTFGQENISKEGKFQLTQTLQLRQQST